MEGGIAVLLLLIILVVGGVIGIVMYLTGGALWLGKTSPEGDKIEGDDRGNRFDRPEHKEVTSKTIENTHVVGTRDDERG
jgi:hypothetical protein